MDTVSVSRLRKMAELMLEQLEGYDDNLKVRLVGNTYFLSGGDFIGICGSDGGYVNVNSIADNVVDDEDF